MGGLEFDDQVDSAGLPWDDPRADPMADVQAWADKVKDGMVSMSVGLLLPVGLQWEEPKVSLQDETEGTSEALASETVVVQMTRSDRELCRQVLRDLIRDPMLLRGLGPGMGAELMGAVVSVDQKQAALSALNRSLYSS